MKLIAGILVVGMMGLVGCNGMQQSTNGGTRGGVWRGGPVSSQRGGGNLHQPIKLTMADGSKIEVLGVNGQETIAGHKFLNVRTSHGTVQVRIEHIATVEGGDLRTLVNQPAGRAGQQSGRGEGRGGFGGGWGGGGPERDGWDRGGGWGGPGGGMGRGGPGMMGGRGMGPMGGGMRGGPAPQERKAPEKGEKDKKEAPKKDAETKKASSAPKAEKKD